MKQQTERNGRKKRRGRLSILLMSLLSLCLALGACGGLENIPTKLQAEDGETRAPRTTKVHSEGTAATSTQTKAQDQTAAPAASSAFPAAVVDPRLTGTWEYHESVTDVDLVWTFNKDGTGTYYANGMTLPIASYVATTEPFTEYPEDGLLITVYYAEMTETFGDTVVTTQMDPVEYGYLIEGDTLRIVFSRDIANHYTEYKRK